MQPQVESQNNDHPIVSFAERHSASIDDYCHDASIIWRQDRKQRSIFDIWLHVVDYCTRLVEAVRREKHSKVIGDISNTVFWLLSFIAQAKESRCQLDKHFRLTKNPSEIIWNKYPGMCPACIDNYVMRLVPESHPDCEKYLVDNYDKLKEEIKNAALDTLKKNKFPVPCTCLSDVNKVEKRHDMEDAVNDMKNDLRLEFAKEIKANMKDKILSLVDFENMFEGIFRNNYQLLSVQNIAFHLLEEVGEVSGALVNCYVYKTEELSKDIREINLRKSKLEEEVADVFSWLFALLLKIRNIYFEDSQEYLDKVRRLYGGVKEHNKTTGQLSLADIIWIKNGIHPKKNGKDGEREITDYLRCSKCHKIRCECSRYFIIDWINLYSENEGRNY